jgi:hypothetical protein
MKKTRKAARQVHRMSLSILNFSTESPSAKEFPKIMIMKNYEMKNIFFFIV